MVYDSIPIPIKKIKKNHRPPMQAKARGSFKTAVKITNFLKTKRPIEIFGTVIISSVLLTVFVYAATTIGSNISTDGNLTVSGNVGIGTTSPGALLDVNGPVRINGGTVFAGDGLDVGFSIRVTRSSGTPFFAFEREGAGASGNQISAINGMALDSGGVRTMFSSIKMYSNIYTNGAEVGEIRFNNFVAGVATDVLNIVAGNVGIGTTSPTVPLQVTTASANATTTMEIGKANQNKGTCLKMYDATGTVKYVSIQGGSLVVSDGSCE